MLSGRGVSPSISSLPPPFSLSLFLGFLGEDPKAIKAQTSSCRTLDLRSSAHMGSYVPMRSVWVKTSPCVPACVQGIQALGPRVNVYAGMLWRRCLACVIVSICALKCDPQGWFRLCPLTSFLNYDPPSLRATSWLQKPSLLDLNPQPLRESSYSPLKTLGPQPQCGVPITTVA